MKKGSFIGLLYREYYLGRNSYITGLLFFAGHALIGWLALLSLKYGNFGLLFGDISESGGVIKNKELSEILRLMIIMFMKYMPLVMAFMFAAASADTAAKDTLNKWNRFEHCTPVTPLRFAAVKTATTAVSAAVSFLLAVIYLFSITFALGEKFTYGDFSVIIAFITLFTVLASILPQIFITLLKSRDMGWLCTMAVFMVPAFIVSATNAAKENEAPSANENADIAAEISLITDKAQEYCPLAIGVLIIAFAMLFISMYLLYKRREK